MTPSDLSLDVLQGVPLFAGLATDECRTVADASRFVEFDAGEIVLRQGATSQNLWVVWDGKCEVVWTPASGKAVEEVVLAELAPHQSFGEMSFFHEAPHSASVRAKTKVVLMRLERARYDALVQDGCHGALKLALNTVGALAERLRRMDGWVAELLNAPASPKSPPPDEWTQFRHKLLNGFDIV